MLCLQATLTAVAQQGQLSGQVTDASNGETLIGVNVIYGEGSGVATDINGSYTLNLEPGTYRITFKYIGYEPVNYEAVIKSGDQFTKNIELMPAAGQLDVVVVSASRYEQRFEDLTVSMEVIKPYLVENRNNTSIAQVLDQTPGVILVDGEPQIRGGSGYSFGAGSRVQVLLDDIPMLSGDIGRPNWGYLPTENVEQIEVIKGASSVLYGSSALSGVINLRTAYPRDEPKTKVSVFTGMYMAPRTDDELYWRQPGYRHELGVYHPVQDVIANPMQGGMSFFHSRKIKQLDVVFGANFFSDMGYTGPELPTDTSHVDENGQPRILEFSESGDTLWRKPAQMSENRVRGNLNLRYRFKNIEGLSVGINSNAMYSLSSFSLLWLNSNEGLYRPRLNGITTTKQLNFNLDPYIEYVNNKGQSHKLKTRYFHLDNLNTNNQSNWSRTYFAEYLASQNFDHYGINGLNVTIGAMTSYTAARSDLYVANEAGDGNNSAHNSALFMQIDKRFFHRLTLSGGVRYEWYNVNNEVMAAPIFRTGANFQLLDGTFLRTSIGQGIRFPTIGERFIITSVGGQNIFPNPDLKAERSYSAEFGVKQGFEFFGFRGFIDAAYFYQEFDNFIEFTFGPWGTRVIQIGDNVYPDLFNMDKIVGFKSVNTGKAKVQGLDFSLLGEGEIGPVGLRMLFGYTYVLPMSMDPDKPYAEPEMASLVNNDGSSEFLNDLIFNPITYHNTSSYPDEDLLKYRVEHMAKLDIELSYKKFTLGSSVRMHTPIRNIDRTFIILDEDGYNMLPSGISKWMKEKTDPVYIVDMRVSYQLSPRSKLALISNNLFNTEYAIRPLTIESPGLAMVQYTWEM